MEYSTYFTIRQLLMMVVLFMGCHQLLVSLPKSVSGLLYKKSLRLMGFAFLVVPLSCIIYTLENRYDIKPQISTVINLSAYFVTFVFMSMAFLTLLGRDLSKKMIAIVAIVTVIYPIPMWLCIANGDENLISTAITSSYSVFVTMIIALATIIMRKHKEAARNIENFFTNELILGVKWVSKSIILLIGLSAVCVTAPIFFTYPYWLRFTFMFYGFLCFLHIFYGYRRILINLIIIQAKQNYDMTLISEVVSSHIDENISISPEVRQSIKTELDKWIRNRGYCGRSITIIDVAKSINTNRTYLSKYINVEYKCSFRVWVTKLRIDEAKLLMAERADLTIYDIAKTIGSASVESFTHLFTRYEGVAPAKWRENNASNNINIAK